MLEYVKNPNSKRMTAMVLVRFISESSPRMCEISELLLNMYCPKPFPPDATPTVTLLRSYTHTVQSSYRKGKRRLNQYAKCQDVFMWGDKSMLRITRNVIATTMPSGD